MIYRRYYSEEDKSKDSEFLYFSDLSKSFYKAPLPLVFSSCSPSFAHIYKLNY